MTYAGARRILDADSHLMELPGFLDPHLDPTAPGAIRGGDFAAFAPAVSPALEAAAGRRADAGAMAAAEERLLLDKGWLGLGAFDPEERSRALDLFGFEAQLVFATFAYTLFLGRDVDRLYTGARAQNRAVAAFCQDDERLLPVAFVPLNDPYRAVDLLGEALELGCGAVHVPSTAAGERSPTHPALHPFWAMLEAADVPFVLHVGGGGRLLDPAFHQNDMPVTDHLGGGENLRAKDYLAIHHSPEVFLGALILDGHFDRFPALRGASIEQGAGWVISWMRHLDQATRSFRRTEEPLRRLHHEPSEYVRRHLKFTPFPGEPVGWMIEQGGAELFMFSSDFPHPEGGRDPLAKFEEAMGGTSAADQDRFYAGNMAKLLGASRPAG